MAKNHNTEIISNKNTFRQDSLSELRFNVLSFEFLFSIPLLFLLLAPIILVSFERLVYPFLVPIYASAIWGVVLIPIYYLFIRNKYGKFGNRLFANRAFYFFLAFVVWGLIASIRGYYGLVSYAILGDDYIREGYLTDVCYVMIFYMASLIKRQNLKWLILGTFFFAGTYVMEVADIETIRNIDVSVIVSNRGVFFNTNHYGYYITLLGGLFASMIVFTKQLIVRVLYILLYIIDVIALCAANVMGGSLAAIFMLIFLFIVSRLTSIRPRKYDMELYERTKDKWSVTDWIINLLPAFIFVALFVFYTLYVSSAVVDSYIALFYDMKRIASTTAATSAQAVGDIGAAGSGRWGLWMMTIGKIFESPLFGWGQNGVVNYLFYEGGSGTPHNEYLQHAVQFGIPALIFYLAGVMCVFLKALRHRFMLSTVEKAAIVSAFAYLVSAFFGVTMYYTTPLFWLVLGLAWPSADTPAGLLPEYHSSPSTSSGPSPKKPPRK